VSWTAEFGKIFRGKLWALIIIIIAVVGGHWSVVECSMPSDFNLERTLALNHSFETYIVTRQSVARSLRYVNNTHVVRTTIVANDPADFSRNSFAQRTLNDLLAVQGHGAASIDLLRLVGTDSDTVSMSDLVHFLVADGVLKHVNQLHLTVYIGVSFLAYLLLVMDNNLKLKTCQVFLRVAIFFEPTLLSYRQFF